jgi:hypothetical protein
MTKLQSALIRFSEHGHQQADGPLLLIQHTRRKDRGSGCQPIKTSRDSCETDCQRQPYTQGALRLAASDDQ